MPTSKHRRKAGGKAVPHPSPKLYQRRFPKQKLPTPEGRSIEPSANPNQQYTVPFRRTAPEAGLVAQPKAKPAEQVAA